MRKKLYKDLMTECDDVFPHYTGLDKSLFHDVLAKSRVFIEKPRRSMYTTRGSTLTRGVSYRHGLTTENRLLMVLCALKGNMKASFIKLLFGVSRQTFSLDLRHVLFSLQLALKEEIRIPRQCELSSIARYIWIN